MVVLERSALLRRALAGFSVLILIFVVVVAVREDTATATSGDTPYTVPVFSESSPAPNKDINPDPNIVEVNISADEETVDVGGGVMANVYAYNGTVPGPEFRITPGQRVIVHFTNDLNEHTGIHWHGIELANRNDGTPLTQNQVPPGGTYLYDFVAPREGIYWYHPHHEFSTNQVLKGLYGSMVIKDPTESALVASGVLPAPAKTRTLVLSDITVCKDPDPNDDGSTADTQNPAQTHDPALPHVSGGPLPAQPAPSPRTLCDTPMDNHGVPLPGGTFLAPGDVPNIQSVSGRVNEGQTTLTNGMNVGGRGGNPAAPGALGPNAATLDVQPGQGLRLQLVNAATTRFFRLRLTDSAGAQIPLVRVGGEGGLLDDAVLEGTTVGGFDFKYGQGEIVVDPGDRADVVAAIPSTASGVATLWTMDFERTGQGFANIPTVPVAHFDVTGPTVVPAYEIDGDPLDGDPTTALRSGIDPVEVLPPPTGALLDPTAFSPPKTGSAIQDMRFTVTGGPSIDDVAAHHNFAIDYAAQAHEASTRYAKLGDVLQLTVTNTTLAHHPFHLHGFSIQPLSLSNCKDKATPPPHGLLPVSGFSFPEAEFLDNIDVPALCTLTFRVRLDDRPQADGTTGGGLGRWVIHCHIFFHHHQGMTNELVVVSPDGDERPYVDADEAATAAVPEGQVATMTGTYSDPDADPVTLTASIGAVQDLGGGQWSWSYTTTDGPDENQTVVITATANGVSTMTGFGLLVNNLPPTVTATSAAYVYPVGSNVIVSGSITDPGAGDTHQCRFDWDDGSGFGLYGPLGSCSESRIINAAGVYSVAVEARDDDGGTSLPSTILIAVYDPSAGFVTGGGRIESLPGSYVADPAAAGPANFGFVSRYKKGAQVPDGQTEFQFKAGNLNFHSTSYAWLVVSGPKSQYKGSGRINGAGNYGFLLTATDGQVLGGGGLDKFRIKIWDKNRGNALVYDNVLGAPEDMDLASPQVITQGSIVIHKAK